jgi:hypothetical protein
MKNAILLAGCLVLSASAAYAQSVGPSSAPDKPSERLLTNMRADFHLKVGRLTGIKNVQDVDQTQFGPAIPTFRVDLSALQAYDGTSPVDSLLSPTPLATRLLRVNGTVESCHVLAKIDGEWTTYRIGAANRAVAIDRVSQILTGKYGANPNGLFLVESPQLSLEFLAYRNGGTLMMAWLGYGPGREGLVAGQPMVAESLLGSLVSAAQSAGGSRAR